jgi:hypothetical protein
MMKRILVLFGIIILFSGCDYTQESVEFKPDIEIVGMNPVAWYTYQGDITPAAEVDTIKFVAENSVDCYIDKIVWEYFDEDDNSFAGPYEMALYFKIEGKVDPADIDTFFLQNIQLPLLPVQNNINPGHSARVLLSFIAVDEYYGENYDTCTAWYGIYMWPQ